MYSTIPYWG